MLTREEYAAIVEHAPVMIWRADASGACDYFNERWLSFRGRTLEQEAGAGWAEGIHPSDRGQYLNGWAVNIADRKRFQLDFRLQHQDGEYRWVHGSALPMYSGAGAFTGYIGMCIEFTLLAALSLRGPRHELKNIDALLSLCSWCHRVQDKQGEWQHLEAWIASRSSLTFTHGICPDCADKQAEAATG